MSIPFEQFRNSVIEALLRGDDDVLVRLREQMAASVCRGPKFTGAGFFADIAVGSSAKPLRNRPTFRIEDVAGEIAGLVNGAGFILSVKDGFIDQLEGYSFNEAWPRIIEGYALNYLANEGVRVVSAPSRDVDAIHAIPGWPTP